MTTHTPADTDLAALLAAFDASLAADDGAMLTRRRYGSVVRGFCAWFVETNHEPFTPARLTPIDLIAYRAHIQKTQQASSVNVQIAALRAFSTFLCEGKHRTDNPALKLKSIGRTQQLAPKALKPPEINALLRAAQQAGRQSALKYAVVQLLLQTGLREGECAGLLIGDVQLGERQGELLIRKGKGNVSRTVPLNASARVALAAYLGPRWNVDATVKAVAGVWALHAGEALFVGVRGAALGTSGIYKIIINLVAAGRSLIGADTTPHTLRHTFAYAYLADHPGDLVGVAALLGHRTLEVTRIYVQPRATDLAHKVEEGRLNAYG